MTVFYVILTGTVLLLALLVLLDRLAPATAARLGLALERWRSGLHLKAAQVPGFAMPYLQGGAGEPLVLIHGFAGDKDNFTRIARFLTPHYRVICPDLPGFGDAGRDPQARYTMADQVERLRAFLDQLQLHKVHLGGNSMGGFISAQFAATYPERVASLWLLDAAGTEAAHTSGVLQHYAASGEMPLLVRSESDFAALMKAATHKTPFLPYSVRTMLAHRAMADYPLHSQIMVQLTQSPSLESQYQALRTPAFVVWGAEDQILHPSGADTLRALFPNSRVRMMPAIGHLPMLEAPKRTALDYLAYRRELGAV